jgi:hypothetical protein
VRVLGHSVQTGGAIAGIFPGHEQITPLDSVTESGIKPRETRFGKIMFARHDFSFRHILQGVKIAEIPIDVQLVTKQASTTP